jgi:hypothetical protein
MAASVRWAYFTVGSLKALTPLLTASTPVMAVQPAANPRNTSQAVTAPAPSALPGGAITGCECPPLVHTVQAP